MNQDVLYLGNIKEYISLIVLACCCYCSVTKSCPTLCEPMDCTRQASLSFTISQSLLKLMPIEWCHPTISSCRPLLFLPSLFPYYSKYFNISQHQGLFQWVSSSHQVAKVLELQLQHRSFQWIFRIDFLEDWLVWSPCSPRDSQESSPTPQFKSINSLALSFLYSPTLTSIHDYWKNHSLD